MPACPRCKADVVAADGVGEGVYVCSCGCFVCDGTARKRLTAWLRVDEGLYQQLLKEGGKGPSCSFCPDRLRTLSLKGVVVDGCASCHALLLDRGELARLTGMQEPAPPPAAAPAPTSSPMVAGVEGGRVYVDAPVALASFLGNAPWLQVKQERQIAEALLSIELNNVYAVHTPYAVGHVVRDGDGVGAQLVQLFTGGLLRSRYALHDGRGNPCLTLERRFEKLVLSRLDVRFYEGALLGSVERAFTVATSEYALKDARGRTFATVHRPALSLWQFRVLVDGAEVAKIAKEWSGFVSEYFSDGDDFGLDFGSFPWTLEQRAVLAAAVIAIDLDHFERKGRGNESLWDLLR